MAVLCARNSFTLALWYWGVSGGSLWNEGCFLTFNASGRF